MRLGEHEDAGDGAVRKHAELLTEDRRAPGARSGMERGPQSRLIGEDGRVGDPGIHRVQAHRSHPVERFQHSGSFSRWA